MEEGARARGLEGPVPGREERTWHWDPNITAVLAPPPGLMHIPPCPGPLKSEEVGKEAQEAGPPPVFYSVLFQPVPGSCWERALPLPFPTT